MKIFSTVLAALTTDVPVTPGADEARRWASEELAKKSYQDAKPGVTQLIIGWLRKALGELLDNLGSLQSNTALLVILGVAALVIIAAVVLVRPRLNRRKAQKTTVFAGPVTLTASGHRSLASAAAAQADFATAVREQFRVIVRTAEERNVLSPAPGSTAAEVATELCATFPAHSHAIRRAGDIFNTVSYGHTEATMPMYQELLTTDSALASAMPHYADDLVTL